MTWQIFIRSVPSRAAVTYRPWGSTSTIAGRQSGGRRGSSGLAFVVGATAAWAALAIAPYEWVDAAFAIVGSRDPALDGAPVAAAASIARVVGVGSLGGRPARVGLAVGLVLAPSVVGFVLLALDRRRDVPWRFFGVDARHLVWAATIGLALMRGGELMSTQAPTVAGPARTLAIARRIFRCSVAIGWHTLVLKGVLA